MNVPTFVHALVHRACNIIICSCLIVTLLKDSIIFYDCLLYYQNLFCKIVPHECLHYVMNQKSRDLRKQTAPTVCATIEQFNRLSLAVIATVLQATDSSNVHCANQRGRTLARWIEVAQVLILHTVTKYCSDILLGHLQSLNFHIAMTVMAS